MPTPEASILLIQLPPGYTARPVTLEDAEVAAALDNAYTITLTGRPSITAGEIRSDWGQPIVNLTTNTLVVFAPVGSMAGRAEVWDSEPHVRPYVFAQVHPAHQGLGIGAALAGWAEARGRQLSAIAPDDARVVLHQFKMSADETAARLLGAQGYTVALSQQCFVAFHERGKRRAKLGVDAQRLTGATRLYAKAGMHVARQFDIYEKELPRSGRNMQAEHLLSLELAALRTAAPGFRNHTEVVAALVQPITSVERDSGAVGNAQA